MVADGSGRYAFFQVQNLKSSSNKYWNASWAKCEICVDRSTYHHMNCTYLFCLWLQQSSRHVTTASSFTSYFSCRATYHHSDAILISARPFLRHRDRPEQLIDHNYCNNRIKASRTERNNSVKRSTTISTLLILSFTIPSGKQKKY